MSNPYDYIVVGAGAAGCVVAHRLADRPGARVLLLEQGRRNSSWKVRVPGAVRECFKPGSPYMQRITTPVQQHMDGRTFDLPFGVGLGGTSLVNGMVYLRGLPQDYDRWQVMGATGWAYADVLDYFKRLERMAQSDDPSRGRNGPVGVGRCEDLSELNQAFLAAGNEAGFAQSRDLNGSDPEGFGRIDYNATGGYRSTSAYCYLEHQTRHGHLTVQTDTQVLDVIFDRGAAVGVRYLDREGQVVRSEAQAEVVLCAGALATPKLVMLSGIGPADHLREHGVTLVADVPGVGLNLHDHVELDLQWRCPLPVTHASLLTPWNMFVSGLRWLLFKSGPAALGQCHTGAYVRSNPGLKSPNIELMLFPIGFDGWVPRSDIHAFRTSAMLSRPKSRGRLRLLSAAPMQPPQVDPNYLHAPEDVNALAEACELLQALVRQRALTPYVSGLLDPTVLPTERADIRHMIHRIANAGYHYCGTCRMGSPCDELAVVTPQTAVRGVENLRVADASIMPEVVSSNLNAPVMMIGERCAEFILTGGT